MKSKVGNYVYTAAQILPYKNYDHQNKRYNKNIGCKLCRQQAKAKR